MINFTVDKYKIAIQLHTPPDIYDLWLKHVKYFDIDERNESGTPVYIGIAQGNEWYDDIISFKADPVDYAGFYPGILIVPETGMLFIGAGKVLKVYDLENHIKVFEKELSLGFWGWEKRGNLVLMMEETEFAVYNLYGKELWSTYVEPPWAFEINKDTVILNVMDKLSYRNIITGELINK